MEQLQKDILVIWLHTELAPGHLQQGGILISRGVHKLCVCVCVWGGGGGALPYVHRFIGFTFAFEIDHVQQGGERAQSGG